MNAVASRNIKFVGHCDLGGRGDGVQIMVHRGYAYVGHGFSNGITTVDVRDPARAKVLDFEDQDRVASAGVITPGPKPLLEGDGLQ